MNWFKTARATDRKRGAGTDRDDGARREPRTRRPQDSEGQSNKRPTAQQDGATGALAPTVYLRRDLRNPEPLEGPLPEADTAD